MNYKECPHYEELLLLLSKNKELDDISFELDDIQNCKECSKVNEKGCSLWISLIFIENMRCQMTISEAELTIENIDTKMRKIAFELILQSDSQSKDSD